MNERILGEAMIYVNLIIDNNSDNTDNLYTYGYKYDEEKPLKIGQKVKVKFGRGKNLREAYVIEKNVEPKEKINGLKYVEEVPEAPELSAEMVATALWMRNRYLCRYIEAIKCFLPAGKPSKTGKLRLPHEKAEVEEKLKKEKVLNFEQTEALDKIKKSIKFRDKKIFLLQGVTGSGKTEVYIDSIRECLVLGRSAIVMVPEISLTTQLTERFIGRFGQENIAVLHSKLSPGERYDEWQRIRAGKVKIVIGARSAVFATFEDIGLIILDEEHEATYKADKSPKYETLEVAVKRALNFSTTVILGSATPSVISSYRAETGIYEKIELNCRYNGNPLPFVETVDMAEELKMGNKTIFSEKLYRKMEETLKENKQVILFLNRRGYSYFISCRECGYVVKCKECGISMTYHKRDDVAMCHYCGKKEEIPVTCPQCASKHIRYFGTGTEKVEEKVKELFPNYKSDRLDVDTIGKKGSLERIIKDFHKGKTRILIGTQLVAKGLDFQNVGLVGIVMADVSLNIPDYRAAERTFQLITQASGRAGRGEERGNVIIQTYAGNHYAITSAIDADYEEFYNRELEIRRSLDYPPFTDLVQVVAISKEEEHSRTKACELQEQLSDILEKYEGFHVYKAQRILANQTKEHFRYGIVIKCPKDKRRLCLSVVNRYKFENNTNPKSKVNIIVDINPY